MDSQERNGIAAFIEFTEVQETNLYDNIPSLFAAVKTSIVNDALPITAPMEEHRPATPLSPRRHVLTIACPFILCKAFGNWAVDCFKDCVDWIDPRVI